MTYEAWNAGRLPAGARIVQAADSLPYVVAVRERLRHVNTEQLKRMWDAYDGTNSPLGFAGEDIHLELNMRGEGGYCAV